MSGVADVAPRRLVGLDVGRAIRARSDHATSPLAARATRHPCAGSRVTTSAAGLVEVDALRTGWRRRSWGRCDGRGRRRCEGLRRRLHGRGSGGPDRWVHQDALNPRLRQGSLSTGVLSALAIDKRTLLLNDRGGLLAIGFADTGGRARRGRHRILRAARDQQDHSHEDDAGHDCEGDGARRHPTERGHVRKTAPRRARSVHRSGRLVWTKVNRQASASADAFGLATSPRRRPADVWKLRPASAELYGTAVVLGPALVMVWRSTARAHHRVGSRDLDVAVGAEQRPGPNRGY